MIIKHYSAKCCKCNRDYGYAKDEPSSKCNIAMAYFAKDFADIVLKLIQSKWIEAKEGWICNECQEKLKE